MTTDQAARIDAAAERIFHSGILDEIYDHAHRTGEGLNTEPERDAMADAVEIARLAFDEAEHG